MSYASGSYQNAPSTPLALAELPAAPAAVADKVLLYGFDIGGVTQLYALLSDGTTLDLTPSGGAAPSDAPYLTNGAVVDLTAEVDVTATGAALTWARVIAFAASGYARWGAGTAVVAAEYAVQRDTDATNQLHFNVPTGAGYEWSVNDVAVSTMSASAVALGTNAAAQTITLGNVTGATSVAISAGTGASSWTVTGAGTFTLTAGTGAIALATNATDHSTSVGSGTGASAGVFDCGTGGVTVGTTANGHTTTVGSTNTTSTTAMDAGTGGLNFGQSGSARTWNFAAGAGASVQTVNLFTNAAANVITIGSLTGAASLTLQAGSGNMLLSTAAANGTFTLNTGTGAIAVGSDVTSKTITIGAVSNASAFTLDGGIGTVALFASASARTWNVGTGAAVQTVNLFTGASANVITMGSTTGAASVAISAGTGASGWTVTGVGTFTLTAGTGAINLAANATDHSTTVGGTTGVSALLLQSGTGNASVTTPQWTFTDVAAAAGTPSVVVLTQAVHTGGSPVLLTATGGAHTTLAASTEAVDVSINLARTVQFATGALTTQRAINIAAPTYAFAAASTLTNAITLAVGSCPLEGTNATITNAFALRVGADATIGASAPTQNYAAIRVPSHTITITGGTSNTGAPGFTGCSMGLLTVTDATAVTVDRVTSFFIQAAPTAAGSVTVTNTFGFQVGGATTAGPTSAAMRYAAIDVPAHTVTVTGGTQVTTATAAFAAAALAIVTVTDTTAVTVNNAATLYISGAPAAAGSVTITNAYALWVDAGVTRLDGGLLAGAEAAGVAGFVGYTNTVDNTANSTGTGTILFKGVTSRNSSGFLKILDGVTARFVPYFDAITG